MSEPSASVGVLVTWAGQGQLLGLAGLNFSGGFRHPEPAPGCLEPGSRVILGRGTLAWSRVRHEWAAVVFRFLVKGGPTHKLSLSPGTSRPSQPGSRGVTTPKIRRRKAVKTLTRSYRDLPPHSLARSQMSAHLPFPYGSLACSHARAGTHTSIRALVRFTRIDVLAQAAPLPGTALWPGRTCTDHR